jgi:hypothetical protein
MREVARPLFFGAEMSGQPFVREDKELFLAIYGIGVWVDYDDVDHDEAKKAARLIAAAPDLLEALIECLDCEFAVTEKSVVAKARAVIERATR